MVPIIHALELLLCTNVNTREENNQHEDEPEEHNANAIQANEVDSIQDLYGIWYVQVTFE